MTDRELLEMAARAAGIDGWWEQPYLSFIKRSGGPWRPLTDDGDAHRLESYLRLDVTWGNGSVTVGGVTERYSHGDDPSAVKRRAIVSAAAAIWSKQ